MTIVISTSTCVYCMLLLGFWLNNRLLKRKPRVRFAFMALISLLSLCILALHPICAWSELLDLIALWPWIFPLCAVVLISFLCQPITSVFSKAFDSFCNKVTEFSVFVSVINVVLDSRSAIDIIPLYILYVRTSRRIQQSKWSILQEADLLVLSFSIINFITLRDNLDLTDIKFSSIPLYLSLRFPFTNIRTMGSRAVSLCSNYFVIEKAYGMIIMGLCMKLGTALDIEEELRQLADEYLFVLIDILKAFLVYSYSDDLSRPAFLGVFFDEDFLSFQEDKHISYSQHGARVCDSSTQRY